MKTAFRSFAAVVAGLIVLFALVVAVELFSAVVHPFPEDFGGTPEEVSRHVERYPHWALAVVIPMWAAAALAGTWTAQRIGNLYSSAIIALLLLAGLVCNISMLPYPTWFKFASLLVIPAAALAGIRMSVRRETTGVGAGG